MGQETRLTLDALQRELDRGRVYEVSLHDARWHLDGLQEGENIYIDPRPAVVETLLHELIHRLHPTWSERRVLAESRRLLASMQADDLARWWRRYRRIVKKAKPKVIDAP